MSHKTKFSLQMKKTIALATLFIAFTACQKNKETETSVDGTPVETTADSLFTTDTIAEMTTPAAEPETKPAEKIDVVPNKEVKVEYASFGGKIVADNALTKEQMMKKYKNLKPGDTVSVKFRSKINDVCQKKGCWMAMELPNGQESFVKFRDYAFFVPLNAADSEAIVSGKAFISETSVAQLKHYAKDGGASEEEIAKIIAPKTEYKFMADGVLISR